MTQAELGRRVGVSGKQIGNIERGDSYPTTEEFKKFAEIFDCTVDDLMRSNDDPLARNEKIHQELKMLEELGEVLRKKMRDLEEEIATMRDRSC